MEERVRVLVADDQDLVRSGFKLILMSYDGIDVVGEARDGHEAVELADQFSTEKAPAFINGILGNVARSLAEKQA